MSIKVLDLFQNREANLTFDLFGDKPQSTLKYGLGSLALIVMDVWFLCFRCFFKAHWAKLFSCRGNEAFSS